MLQRWLTSSFTYRTFKLLFQSNTQLITASQINEIYLIIQVHQNIRQLNNEVKSLIHPDFIINIQKRI